MLKQENFFFMNRASDYPRIFETKQLEKLEEGNYAEYKQDVENKLHEEAKVTEQDTSENSDASDESRLKILEGSANIIVSTEDKDSLRSAGEEAWTSEAEKLVGGWANDATDKGKKHSERASSHKCLHSIFGLPSILLPVAFATLTPLIDGVPAHMYIQVGSYIAIGVISGINAFYNFDKRASKHEYYASRYNDLANDVRYQLYKSRRFRVASDEFLARIQAKLSALDEKEP